MCVFPLSLLAVPLASTHKHAPLPLALRRSCQSMRPQMFKLAGDMNQKEDILGEVLIVNDDLTRVMDL